MSKQAIPTCYFRLEKHNGFDTEKAGRNGSHGLNGNGSRVLPPDGMYHTSDIPHGLESGMTDKVDPLIFPSTVAFRCMTRLASEVRGPPAHLRNNQENVTLLSQVQKKATDTHVVIGNGDSKPVSQKHSQMSPHYLPNRLPPSTCV